MDAYDGYVVYRQLDEGALAAEIADMKALIDATAEDLTITQDLGAGMMLWLARFYPDEPWAALHRTRTVEVLDAMWIDPPCRAAPQGAASFERKWSQVFLSRWGARRFSRDRRCSSSLNTYGSPICIAIYCR